MTAFLLGALVAIAIGTLIEGYVLLGRVQILMTFAEQLLDAAHRLLAVVPSKSAARTTAAADIRPRQWWPTLRALADLRDRLLTAPALADADQDLIEPAEPPPVPGPDPLELDRWADDGGRTLVDEEADVIDPEPATEPMPAIPRPDPAPGPATVPSSLAVEIHQALIAAAPKPEPDDVDRLLARFQYAEGHQR